MRKLFIGGLGYSTTEEELRAHFERFGDLVDCVVMKFNDTGRSRGFGFVTYSTAAGLDDCQANRPHELGGKTLETKRATPRSDAGKPEAQASVKKIFIGGVSDEMEDDDIRGHFEEFGKVQTVEQLKWNDTGKKRGFGFVEFDDYDAVDKVVLIGKHTIKVGGTIISSPLTSPPLLHLLYSTFLSPTLSLLLFSSLLLPFSSDSPPPS